MFSGGVYVITICSCIDVHGGLEYDRQNNCENTATGVHVSVESLQTQCAILDKYLYLTSDGILRNVK